MFVLHKYVFTGLIIICVWVLSPTGEKQKYTVKVSKDDYPESVTREAILKKLKCMKMTKEQQQNCAREYQHSYLLKVCGIDQYLLERYPLSQYKVSIIKFYLHISEKNVLYDPCCFINPDALYLKSVLPENGFLMGMHLASILENI